MLLDVVLDSVYLLGSLWGGATSPAACPARPGVLPHARAAATWAPGPRTSTAVTAFVDVNVVPLDSERVLPNQTVLVEGGRITALGPSDKITVPAGAVRIDGRGKYLIPGFSNMHIDGRGDYGQPQLFSMLASGITAIRPNNPVSLDQLHKVRHSPEAQERLSPYIYLAGPLRAFAGPGRTADSAAAAYKAAGYDFFTDNGPDSLMTAAHHLGLALGTHFHEASPEMLQEVGTYGGSVDHLYAFLGYDLLDSLNRGQVALAAARLEALVVRTKRAGVWVTPTLDCMESISGRLESPANVQAHRQLVKALHDAGVGLLLGAEKAYAYRELAALVRAGLTPYQALVTGTRNPAQFLGLLEERGTVAVGKGADLVLLYGNPLEDIRHTREPAGVMRAGRWLDRAELDRRLLADPKAGLLREAGRSGIYSNSLPDEQQRKVRNHAKRFEALTDSLEMAKSPGSERLRRQLAAELGALYATLTPELQETFDPVVRLWLRAQARRGFPVTVPGVALVP
jgi:imidazolonepropionase-like amidohydrolase